MSHAQSTEQEASVAVENVGGIDTTEVAFSPGVTALTGRNATNRTSLLRAVMGALGSDAVTLKGDADAGEVELAFEDGVYTRTLERRNGTVVTGGDPYLEDPVGADLFAFLLESNEARQAVARGDDLREVIMRPVDTAAINAEIEQLEAEKRDLDDRLEDLDALETRLPDLEEQRTQLESRIEDERAALAEKEAEIEAEDANVEATREQKADFEAALDDLQDTRSALEDVRYRLDSERESLAALEEEREEVEADLADLPETPAGDIEEIESEIDRLRTHKQSVESTITQLQQVLQFNEGMLEGDNDLQAALRTDDAPTDRLVEDSTTVCWTCGSEVEQTAITETLEGLRDLREDHTKERSEITEDLDDLTDQRDELRGERDRRERLQRTRTDLEEEHEEREATIEDLEDEREHLAEEIEELEAEVEAAETEDRSEVLDLHKEANQLEFEIGRLEDDLDETTTKIGEVEAKLDEREEIEERREEVREDLSDLRTRIEQLEVEAIEEFNEHAATILGVLDYENIERVWIERTRREVREGRRTVERSEFDLHVIRSTDSGTTYEDTVAHLSESEREVTGLVFALAGYLVHDLHETLPFMLVDSLEALDSDRIAALVEYLSEYVEYLVVALLPEDAAALSETHRRVTEM